MASPTNAAHGVLPLCGGFGHSLTRRLRLRLRNDPMLAPSVASLLASTATRAGCCQRDDRKRVSTALSEALSNAIIHGNLEVSSALRNEGQDAAYRQLIQRRMAETPYKDRTVTIVSETSRLGATWVISDQGVGFDPRALPDPTDPLLRLQFSGRGILVMRSVFHSVEYNAQGTSVTLRLDAA